MSVFFIGDLHFGHKKILEFGQRDFATIEEHDAGVAEAWNQAIRKKHDLIFVLGDVAMTREGLEQMRDLPGRKILIRGNHDTFSTLDYLAAGFEEVHGFRGYKEFWLSHCPIHESEMYRRKGNIHGHNHFPERNLGGQYINVNADCVGLAPVSLDWVRAKLEEQTNGID